MRGLFIITLLASVVGCTNDRIFQCGTNDDCRYDRMTGVCEDVGYCSFPDIACPSGSRYGDLSPEPYAGACVPGAAGQVDEDDDEAGNEGGSDDGAGDSASSGVSETWTTGAEDESSSGEPPPDSPYCGDGVVDLDEECDGDALGALPTCGDHGGFPADDPVDCRDCEYRLAVCAAVCGDGTIHDMYEQCDPKASDELNGRDCTDLGYLGGVLACDANTCQYDASGCTG